MRASMLAALHSAAMRSCRAARAGGCCAYGLSYSPRGAGILCGSNGTTLAARVASAQSVARSNALCRPAGERSLVAQ
jgi:hypothetical protein